LRKRKAAGDGDATESPLSDKDHGNRAERAKKAERIIQYRNIDEQ
jgi:hypothetical protein